MIKLQPDRPRGHFKRRGALLGQKAKGNKGRRMDEAKGTSPALYKPL